MLKIELLDCDIEHLGVQQEVVLAVSVGMEGGWVPFVQWEGDKNVRLDTPNIRSCPDYPKDSVKLYQDVLLNLFMTENM